MGPKKSESKDSAPSKQEKEKVKDEGHNESDVEGEHNEWKFKDPYKVHDNENGDFKALYEGECHCGRVKYQLGREKPMNAKFCHCSTCQVLHGMFPFLFLSFILLYPNFGLQLQLKLEAVFGGKE